jgi:signal transduction histidine kinase/CheY-like chemotaxis protein
MTEIDILKAEIADLEQLLELQTSSIVAAEERMRDLVRELERSRDEALESARMKSRFLANMSHELRTPMNGVMGMAMLLLETRLDPEQREFSTTILRSAEALLVVLNDILDFSKIEAGKLDIDAAPFDLLTTLEECLQVVAPGASAKGLELTFNYPGELPRFFVGDEGRIRQIVLNLAGNAVKFTETGHVSLSAATDGAETVIEIEDSGIGIAPDRLTRLFEAFEQGDTSMTRQFGGTGLGLSISRRLAQLMGGAIEVDSTPGKGSTFRVRLPLVLTQADDLPPPDRLNGSRLLIVDDHPVNRRVLERQLTSRGAHVTTVASGAEALAVLQADRFDTIITDLMMPAMDGWTLARRVTSEIPSPPPLLMLTSGGPPAPLPELRTAGIRACIAKPVRVTRLVQEVQAILFPGLARREPEPGLIWPEEVPRARARLLIVDDNRVNLMVAAGLLRRLGYQVDTAGSGLEALESVQGNRFDGIFLDCQMPGIDGFEVARRLRQLCSGEQCPRIIAMTAMAMAGDRDRCLKAGMDDYITKPVNRRALEEILERWFGRARPRPSPHSWQEILA